MLYFLFFLLFYYEFPFDGVYRTSSIHPLFTIIPGESPQTVAASSNVTGSDSCPEGEQQALCVFSPSLSLKESLSKHTCGV